jgi:uncharacterized protein YuzE
MHIRQRERTGISKEGDAMKIKYPAETDAFCISLTGNEIEVTKEVFEGVVVDYGKNGIVVGLE